MGSLQRLHCVTLILVTQHRLDLKEACPSPSPSPLPSSSGYLRGFSLPPPTNQEGEITSGPPQAWSFLPPGICFLSRVTHPEASAGGGLGMLCN